MSAYEGDSGGVWVPADELEVLRAEQDARRMSDERREQLAERIRTFSTEGTTYWRNQFLAHDPDMYSEGDEFAPFFTEAFLYNLLGKDEARSVLGILRELCDLAGVKYR